MNKKDLKKLFDRGTSVTPEKLAILIDNIGGGSGIEIVDSVDKLDPNAELGSMASVVTPSNIQETSFRNLYQPDASMIDPNTGTLTQPELLSSVSSIKVFGIPNINTIGFEMVDCFLILVPRDFSDSNRSVISINFSSEHLSLYASAIIDGKSNDFVLANYSIGSIDVWDNHVEAFNAILANGMDWCYFGEPETFNITEEQFNTLDLFINASDKSTSVKTYIKKDEWQETDKEIYNEINTVSNTLVEVSNTINSKADKIPFATYDSWKGLQPNVYTTYSIDYTSSFTIKLAAIQSGSIYNEYILELKCNATPSSVTFNSADGTAATIVWANGIAPTFEAGMTYLISIANGFGVYSVFPNS